MRETTARAIIGYMYNDRAYCLRCTSAAPIATEDGWVAEIVLPIFAATAEAVYCDDCGTQLAAAR